MLADYYIPRLSNDMKIAVQKYNLGDQMWYRSLDPVKKRRQYQPLYLWIEMSLTTDGSICSVRDHVSDVSTYTADDVVEWIGSDTFNNY
mgnify:CR=1 FL=1